MNINTLLKELTESLENEFKDNFTGLVLFGSYAINKQKSTSDIDIFLTFKKLPNLRYERIKLISKFVDEIEEKYNIPINPIVSQEDKLQKSYFIIDIAEYAKILVDKNNKIHNIFQEIKKDYEKGLAKKKKVGNHYLLWVSEDISEYGQS